ncbi:MAG: hypothetical protein IJC16_10050 [Rikenellaceae bacterium]|nr:hypothetical protein [Rikenellaceae bacterium]
MNTKFVICVGALLAVGVCPPVVSAQESVGTLFERHVYPGLQEKLYVHTDRDDYLAGERVWMKLYCVDAARHCPADLSRVAYAEILDASDTPVCQVKLELSGGLGSGNFWLPVTLPSGSYTLRAYTNWMKNQGAELFFDKPIRIVNAMSARQDEASPVAPAGPAYDIQFFPEGGDLVTDLESTVGFRAVDRYGRGVDVSGFVVSSQGDTVSRFRTRKFGLGRFDFMPLQGLEYMAVVEVPGGQRLHLKLPAIRPEGYVMKLSDLSADRLAIDISSSFVLTERPLTLLAHDRGQVVYEGRMRIRNGQARFEVDKSRFRPGIVHFTLFDANRRPRCERLYYAAGMPGQMAVSMATDRSEYGLREPVSLELRGADSAFMSLSVYNLDGEPVDEADMLSYLMLTSELGTVESPGYYLGAESAELAHDRDNLMLTHGWRRFDWKRILDADSAAVWTYLPEREGHLVSGRVTGPLPRERLKDIPVYLSVPGPMLNVYTTRTRDGGEFLFNVLHFNTGSSQLAVEPEASVDSALRITLRSPFFEEYAQRPHAPFELSDSAVQSIIDRNIYMQARNLYAPVQPSAVPVDQGRFACDYRPHSTFMLDDYTRFPLMSEVYTEFISSARFRQVNGYQQVFVTGDMAKEGSYETPGLVLLDGVRITDPGQIYRYDPLKVRKIENFQSIYVRGNSAFYGVSSLSTPEGNLPGFTLAPQVLMADYASLQPHMEFFAPRYASPEARGSRLPDFRNVMYWAPDIRTGGDGQARLTWYTSDLAGEYVAVLRGISADGRPISQTLRFSVRE